MNFRFIWIGKTKDPSWRSLQEDYYRRISHFASCNILEIKDNMRADVTAEGKQFLKNLSSRDLVVLLDVDGRKLSSHDLADTISSWQSRSIRDIAFIIGGANGVASEVAERADIRLSLSFLTFTHEMSRVILLEQLYRAFCIINRFPYQK
ncbi:MAG: 23S rRNA (pseudouridine(1915)-N(3))-methyltransferase RlmH [Acidobacteria bacterium]|nr:23S rRNA (pseudouridine(1915)-N(3))-methyltransferase RlmH [Acidobacteriota bacterium]